MTVVLPRAVPDSVGIGRGETASARNDGVDCLRALAILLVIIHHLALPFRLPLEPSMLGPWLPARLINAVSFNGYEAVHMFFVISGFLITTGIVRHDGDLSRVNLRRFYAARARRILPLLCVMLAVLSTLAWLGVPGFAPDPAEQSVGGMLLAALTFTFNWYEGRTGWAPPAWDVLWSLSIEEVFYLGFPLLCLWLPRRVLTGLLLAWALAMIPLRSLVPISDDIWWEKAYLPGMAAIAWGVLFALWLPKLVRRLPSHSVSGTRAWPALGALGGLGVVLGWSDLLDRYLFQCGLYVLCIGTGLLLVAMYARPVRLPRVLAWLARLGALSYELYLSHMLVVLAVQALYRAQFGVAQTWTFAVYLPALLCCYLLARALARLVARVQRLQHSTKGT